MSRRQLTVKAFDPTYRQFYLLPILMLLLLPIATIAQNRDRSRRATQSNASSTPPTVTLAPDTTVVTLCPEDAARAQTEVRLTAQTTGFDSVSNVRYTWTASGGQIRNDGSTAIWDLSGVAPGVYTITLEVDNGTDTACRAFTSATVVSRPCSPVRVQCPHVTIACTEAVEAGQPVSVTANISGARADISPVFSWTVTGGTIIGGQGTPAISVDTAGLGGNSFTASVQVSGFDPTCPLTASCTVVANPVPLSRRFDEFPSISFDDDKARLDNFAIELQNDPAARGFIVAYSGRRSRPDQTSRMGERARRYLTKVRGIEASRLIVVGGGERDHDTYELYIVPVGATPPSVGR